MNDIHEADAHLLVHKSKPWRKTCMHRNVEESNMNMLNEKSSKLKGRRSQKDSEKEKRMTGKEERGKKATN